MLIKRGLLQSFNPTTYTAAVLLLEATSYALPAIPVANHIDGTSCLSGAFCVVLFFDEHNLQDAVVIATFANGAQGLPAPPPGRLTMVSSYRQINGDSISAGSTATYSLSGGSSGLPTGTLAVLYKASFSSSTVGAFIHLSLHGASDITAYASIGTTSIANSTLYGGGLLPIDASGKIDIKANTGSCTVTLYTYGYVI